jgi:hypothetical protein
VLLVALLACAAAARSQDSAAAFKRLAAQLVENRLNGEDSKESVQEEALGILDRIALAALNSPAPDLAALNERLARLVTQAPAVGESYAVVPLGTGPRAYALVANFGLSGPSAVRLYAGPAGGLRRIARIDRFRQEDFFDEYMELVPLAGADAVFVTVTGRTDELETGAFAAWHLDGERLKLLWSTEILQQSSYEAGPAEAGFRVTFCAETDEDRPRVCRQMVRERYVWSSGEWKRAERQALPAAKP